MPTVAYLISLSVHQHITPYALQIPSEVTSMAATASRLVLLRCRRRVLEQCDSVESLYNTLTTIVDSAFAPFLVDNPMFAATCRAAHEVALAACDGAVLAVRQAVQNADGG